MKLLLISDESMNENAGGLSQTLYNILCFLPAENILCITSAQAYKTNPPSPPFNKRYITYNFKLLPMPKNRFAKYIQGFINWFNYSVNYQFKRFAKILSAIRKFDPDVVLTCPNGAEGLFMYYKLEPAFKGKKVYPYFMDDWLHQSDLKWPGGDIHQLAKKILSENLDWLMISKNLGNILSERYQVQPAALLEIHNPVDISGIPPAQPLIIKKEYTVAYAGSLWPMHFDAFLAMAEAIGILKDTRKINLILYTAQSQWEWRKNELEKLCITYGGSIPYKEIHATLAKADCLLVTSAFSEAWKTHSKASVQTKLTDYLKAQKLIISCGPAYAANHEFIKTHDCGLCIETNDPRMIAKELNDILNNIILYQRLVHNGLALLKNEFSFEKVHEKFRSFISAH